MPSLLLPLGHVEGRSAGMQRVYHQLSRLAQIRDAVFIRGETGVGKEHLAQAVHLSSPRSRGPFVALNCAAIPAELLEAEMFGIERGTATGVAGRVGRFEQAHGGTLFLDEVGDLAPPTQAKLLRALEQQEVQVVGGGVRQIDVRVVSASHRDLAAEARLGRFRGDLYFRIAGHVVLVPPLRERRDDIPLLVRVFLERASRSAGCRHVPGITRGALDELVAAPWPGNVRQLDHAVRRLVVFREEERPIDRALTLAYAAEQGEAATVSAGDELDLDLRARVGALEAKLVRQALRVSGGHQGRAAELLNIHRNTLTAKIRRLRQVDAEV